MRYWESARSKTTVRSRRRPAPRRSIALGGSLKDYPFLRKFYQHQAVVSNSVQKFLFFLLVATMLYAFVFGDAGAIRMFTLRSEKAKVEADLGKIRADMAALEAQIVRVQNDPVEMERLGRERYGYIRPGDQVYKIIHADK